MFDGEVLERGRLRWVDRNVQGRSMAAEVPVEKAAVEQCT